MLTGPLMTIGSNGSELAIIPSCTADLLYNESMVLLQNAQAPFEAFKKGDITSHHKPWCPPSASTNSCGS